MVPIVKLKMPEVDINFLLQSDIFNAVYADFLTYRHIWPPKGDYLQ